MPPAKPDGAPPGPSRPPDNVRPSVARGGRRGSIGDTNQKDVRGANHAWPTAMQGAGVASRPHVASGVLPPGFMPPGMPPPGMMPPGMHPPGLLPPGPPLWPVVGGHELGPEFHRVPPPMPPPVPPPVPPPAPPPTPPPTPLFVPPPAPQHSPLFGLPKGPLPAPRYSPDMMFTMSGGMSGGGHELAPAHAHAHAAGPAFSTPFDFHRVLQSVPPLQAHTPLAAAVSAHAMLPPPHAGAADVWAAAAHFLHTLRRAYLAGEEMPVIPGMAPAVLRLAVFTDVTAGEGGILGQSTNDDNSGGGSGGGADPPRAPRGPVPRAEPLPALPDAYVGFLRSGGLALCVKRALEGPTAALAGPVAGGVTLGGAEPVDFGLQRCAATSTTAAAAAAGMGNDAWWGDNLWGGGGGCGGGGGGRLWVGVGGSAVAAAAAATAAAAAAAPVRTRHLTITNAGSSTVLLLAVTAAPQLPAAFRWGLGFRVWGLVIRLPIP